MISKTPNTFIVGAGRMATALAGGLRLAGVPVLGLWGRRAEQAREAGARSGVAPFSSAPPDLLLEANVVILAVTDDAIADVATMLVGTGLISRNHVLLHASGSLSSGEVFASVKDRVGGVATLHPLRAVASGTAAIRDWKGCMFGVEGDERGQRVAGDLATALGGEVLPLAGEAMAAYHTAAATASNYLVALLDASTQILDSAGIGGERAARALIGLMRGTLENAAERGTTAGLTGPIARGDADTVARHLAVLEGSSDRVADVYRSLGKLTVEIARRRGDLEGLDEIESLLEGRAASPPRRSISG